MHDDASDILDFWFADCVMDPDKALARNGFWYGVNEDTDREIEARFLTLLQAAEAGACDDWLGDPESALALVILLDQFLRNIWRGTASGETFGQG